MKKQMIFRTAAVLSAAMLLSGSILMPQASLPGARQPLTAMAAADDYPWSTYLKKDASWFSSSEAIGVADDCIRYQIPNEGGWRKGMATEQTGDWAHSTIDNDVTTSQIRVLMRVYKATGQQKYYECALRGIDCLFKMQYSNGGYMQVLNTPGTYHAHITLNDGAYVHVCEIMKEMRDKTGDFTVLSDEYAQKAGASLEKAIQCLLNMQIKINGTLTAWCQQHDENTLAPAAARAYELPSVCTSESAGVIQFLYRTAKETGRSDIVTSVNAAIEWFKKVTLYGVKWVAQGDDKVLVQDANADPLWARFYDLQQQRPLFSDRDSSVHYNVAEISKERRTGYAWYGNWGKNIITLAPLTAGVAVPETDPEYTGQLIAKLQVHDRTNGGKWSIEQGLSVGSQVFGDRDYAYGRIPEEMNGAEYIRTACDSKTYSGDLAELTAAQDLTLYVMIDARLASEQGIMLPWLTGWRQLGGLANTNHSEYFEVWAKDVAAGETVTLGSNMTGQNVVNYAAAVVPRLPEVTTTEPQITTTEPLITTTEPQITTTEPQETTTEPQETTTELISRKMTGDVDCSGDVTVADAVLLARFLAEDTDAFVTVQGKVNAETDGVFGITSEDNGKILEYLANLINCFPV